MEQWYTILNCFIVGGFVVPVLSVLGGILGGFLDLGAHADLSTDTDLDVDLDTDLDLDADGDLDVSADGGGDFEAGHGVGHIKVPVNVMTLSLGAVRGNCGGGAGRG